MADLTFYHKPTCSKSRETKKLLDDAGAEYETVLYIEHPPSLDELRRLAQKLRDAEVKDLLRPKEAKEAGWDGDLDDDEAVLRFLAENPSALQRPIVVRDGTAVIGRPPANVNALL